MFDFSVYGASESASALLQSVDTPYNAPIAFVANTIIFIVINYSSLLGGPRRIQKNANPNENGDEDDQWEAQDLELRGINVPSRSQLPYSLKEWHHRVVAKPISYPAGSAKANSNSPWALLTDFFAKKGGLQLSIPSQRTLTVRTREQRHSGSPSSSMALSPNTLPTYNQEAHGSSNTNGLAYFARTTQGKEVRIRLVKCKSEGKRHLQILRHLRQKSLHLQDSVQNKHDPGALHHNHFSSEISNEHLLEHAHVLPMLSELIFQDLVFGVFPRVDTTLEQVLGKHVAESSLSVGAALDVLIQALEAVVYIHKERIAHQNLFLSNFLLEWQPTSQLLHTVSTTSPRVYLTGFDNAVIFPGEMKAQDMRIPKRSKPLYYERQKVAPELRADSIESDSDLDESEDELRIPTYCPFTMDVWQMGYDLAGFDCGISEVTSIFLAMSRDSTSQRIFAIEGLERLQKIIGSQDQEVFLRPLLPLRLGD